MRRALLSSVILLLLAASAARADDSGMWNYLQATYNLGKTPVYVGFRAEYRSCNNFSDTDLWFLRPLVGWKITPWLKWEVMGDYMRKPGNVQIYQAMTGLSATLREGPLSVTLRERYLYSRNVTADTQKHYLRSYLKAAYKIDNSPFTPYLAVEVFSWDDWIKTRHYAGSALRIDPCCSLDFYYQYHTFATRPASHLLGVGCNLYF